jgi:hypothetical protein
MTAASGSRQLRVRMQVGASEVTEQASVSMAVCDGGGEPVATVGSLQLRRARLEQVRSALQEHGRDLYRVDWQPVLTAQTALSADQVVVVGGDGRLAKRLGVAQVADVSALRTRLQQEGQRPVERVVMDKTCVHPTQERSGLPEAVQAQSAQALEELQQLLSEARLDQAALVWVTSLAISTGADDTVSDLVHAPLWGLLRSARHEHPERMLRVLDVDTLEPSAESLWAMLGADGEPELALRHSQTLAARLQSCNPSSLAAATARGDGAG